MTLPSHASMLSGMVPDKHGIHWNAPYIGWPGMTGPTVFNVLNDMGYTSAMVYGKEKLNYIVLPNGAQSVFADDVHDPIIRNEALRVIEAGLPNLLFVHFPDTDRVGHDYGWMSENQLYAVNFVDGLIGELVSAVEAEGHKKNTLWIVTADHGGHDFHHGDDSPFDRTIPWLATGSGVPSGISLEGVLNTYDTAATILYAFDIPIPDVWDGKPVLGIFQ
jgi:arylsulfatase A-like enzyme